MSEHSGPASGPPEDDPERSEQAEWSSEQAEWSSQPSERTERTSIRRPDRQPEAGDPGSALTLPLGTGAAAPHRGPERDTPERDPADPLLTERFPTDPTPTDPATTGIAPTTTGTAPGSDGTGLGRKTRGIRVRTVVFGLILLAISVSTLVTLLTTARIDGTAVTFVVLIGAGAALVAGGLAAAVREARGGPFS